MTTLYTLPPEDFRTNGSSLTAILVAVAALSATAKRSDGNLLTVGVLDDVQRLLDVYNARRWSYDAAPEPD